MAFKLKRSASVPIMVPDLTSVWENINVFNPSVIYHNGLFHMHYRAEGMDWISRIGYAVSTDGFRWNRLREPVLVPRDEQESRGVQDPRVTEIEGTFYMAYTAWGPYRGGEGLANGNVYPMLAKSANLITWERLGPIVTGEDNKDHVLFPRKYGGRFLAFHRRRPFVWIAYSNDAVVWRERDMAKVFGPREDSWWDSKGVGCNGVPIETEDGWLCFYHAYDEGRVYRLSALLLDRDDPSKVIHRPKEPMFWPEEVWEVRGDVPNVVFSNANILVGDTVYVYYGGGDHVIGLATCKLDDLMEYVRHG
jgi:predicted GH43/DUF377 family glycosyl hydrolase